MFESLCERRENGKVLYCDSIGCKEKQRNVN